MINAVFGEREVLSAIIETRTDFGGETACETLGIEWVPEVVRLGDIDQRDNKYQARLDVSDVYGATVDEYAAAMKQGQIFPRVTLQKKGNGKYRVVCGRNRVAAMLRAYGDDATVEACVVADDCPDNLLLYASTRDNTTNGMRQSTADVARVVASNLMRLPLGESQRQHSNQVIKSESEKAGAVSRTVTCLYYARLAKKSMAEMGLEGSPYDVVMEEAWRLSGTAAWAEIARAISDCRDAAGLHVLLRKLRTQHTEAASIPGLIRDHYATTCGKSRARVDQAVSPFDRLCSCLVMAEREFAQLDSPRNMVEDQADELAGLVEMVRMAMKKWRAK
jgi:hypothetical protein